MKILTDRISLDELKTMAHNRFGQMVKVVVDVQQGVMAVDGELHADEEAILLENGSRQQDLWGINLYPEIEGNDWIEFDSLINLRPSAGNQTRGVDDAEARARIREIVNRWITQ